MNKKKEKKQYGKSIKNNWFMIKLSFQAAPLFMIDHIFEAVKLQCLAFLEHTYGIYFVLEAVEKKKPFIVVGKFIIILMILWAVSFVLSAIYNNIIKIKGTARINQKLKEMMFEKAKDMDLACYDDPAYYNDFILSVSESQNSMERCHNLVKTFSEGLVNLITSGAFFLAVDKVSFGFVLVSFLLNFYFGQKINKFNYNRKIKVNPIERKRAYIHRVSYLNDYAKEIRLNPKVAGILDDDFGRTNQEIYDYDNSIAKKRTKLYFLSSFIANSFIMDFLYITYLVYRASVMHAIPYSAVVVLFNSSFRLNRAFRQLSEVLPTAMENSLYIEKIKEFLMKEKTITDGLGLTVPNETKLLEMKNVSFAYGNQENTLKNINLTIHPHEKIALVGYNGAGKTTLVKLLMRLYDPTEGEILLDQKNIKDYKVNEYRDHIGTVFQDFKVYAADVSENVALDEVSSSEDEKIIEALKQSGFENRLKTLKEGLNTPLTTEFEKDGVNLSGGESQKLAIARVFYKDSSMIILDEPSSALDPISEYELNQTMLCAAEDKSVVFISHRLSTTRQADRIVMLEKGRIIEEGTHEQLLELNGKYAGMWHAQAECYQVE